MMMITRPASECFKRWRDTAPTSFTHADWGRKAGIHHAWMIAELDSQEEALQLIPPQFRPEARIVAFNKFTREEIASLAKELE